MKGLLRGTPPNSQTGNSIALAAGIITIILLALTPTTIRVAVAQVNGLDVGLIRSVAGGGIAIALILLFRIPPPYGRHQWLCLFLSSVGSFVLFPPLFSIGTQRTSAAHASLIMASMPLVTSSIGFILDRRTPRVAWLFRAAIALTGEMVLILTVKGCSLALIFAAFLLGETLSVSLLACGLVILLGVVIAWQNASRPAMTNATVRGDVETVGAQAALSVKSVLAFVSASPIFAAAFAWAPPASADERTVDVLLVLAADVSYSINAREYDLQRAGYVAALTSHPVLSSIVGGSYGRVGICYIEWSGNAAQKVVVDWTMIDSAETARAFAKRIAASLRSFAERTSISAAIDFSVDRLNQAPFASAARIIDISGDGDNNAGRGVANARDDAVRQGITINGLVIINNDPIAAEHTKPIGGLVGYFGRDVVGGPKSFVAVANDFRAFGRVLEKKMATEISQASNGHRFAAVGGR
jgi:Protein of unknown function (DUF1194)/EamA-like transporter family